MSWLVLWIGIFHAGLAIVGPAAATAATVAPDSLREVTFSYQDAGYEQVFLVGSCTDWVRIPLVAAGDRWSITLTTTPAKHYYRFVVSDAGETWEAIDPDNPAAQNHAEFGWVSVLAAGDYGKVADRDRRLAEIRAGKQHREQVKRELRLGQPDISNLAYQRVDGLLLGLAMNQIGAAGTFEPSARAEMGFGFSSGRLSAGLVVLQPVLPQAFLGLKVSLYDRTDYHDQTGIGNLENDLAAFFLHEDYRDYYRNKGVMGSVVFKPTSWLRLETGLSSEKHTSMVAPSVWSLKKGDFGDNPAIDEGSLNSLRAQIRLGSIPNHFHLAYELSTPDLLGGSFTFEQVTATGRGRLNLGPASRIDVRLQAGSNFRGWLPVQRRYLLGGLGTVRGYGYQSLLTSDPAAGTASPHGGERMVLGNLEYSFAFGDWLGMSLFYDVGMAWEDRRATLSTEQLKSSTGLGFKPGNCEWFRIDLIQKLDDRDSKPVVQIRLGRVF